MMALEVIQISPSPDEISTEVIQKAIEAAWPKPLEPVSQKDTNWRFSRRSW